MNLPHGLISGLTTALLVASAQAQTPVAVPNVVPDLDLPAETQSNHFSPELIPDWQFPCRFDAVLGTEMPVKWFIWHQPGRNQFRTVASGTDAEKFESERQAMFSKGITAVVETMIRSSDKEVASPFDPATQLSYGNGINDDAGIRGDWDAWIHWWQGNVAEGGNWSKTRTVDGKKQLFLAYPDYEATYAGAADQQAANYLTVGNYAMLEKSAGYVGQMYLGPINTLGYVNESTYSAAVKTPGWFNAADNSVPERFRGKKNAGNPQIVGSMEIAHFYESWQPEGYVVKDQNGNDWFTITHFGPNPNVEHWAARVGGSIEVSQQYTRAAGQKMIAQLKVCNDRCSGFQYGPESAAWHDGKWNREFNLHGTTHPGPNNTEFLGSIGCESMPNFIAEAQMILAYFCGVDGINFWGSAYYNEFMPRPRQGNPQRGEKYNDPAYGNVDREAMTYVLKALWRLAQPAKLEDGRMRSFYDICDGTEDYLNWNSQVSYDGGKTFAQLRALDWQLQKKTAVRVVVNRRQGVIFIMAFQPYGVEQNQVTVKYDVNGCTFQKTLDVPAGKVVLQAYSLKRSRSQ